MLSVCLFSFQEKLVEMVVNTVEYIDKIAYSLMKSIGENVSCHKNYFVLFLFLFCIQFTLLFPSDSIFSNVLEDE